MLLLLSLLKAISEILALSLIGQGVTWLVAGRSRATSSVHTLFAAITRPLLRFTRLITPRFIPDRHLWMVAVVLVAVIWVVAGQQKSKRCRSQAADNLLCVESARDLREGAGPKR